MTPEFRVTAESLGHQAIGAFRSLADAEVAMPRNGSVSLAVRMEIPWPLVVRRKVQDWIAMKPSKKEREKEETR